MHAPNTPCPERPEMENGATNNFGNDRGGMEQKMDELFDVMNN